MNKTLTRNMKGLVDDLPGYEPEELFDEYGNPTQATLDALNESEYGILEPVTIEELRAEVHALCTENE